MLAISNLQAYNNNVRKGETKFSKGENHGKNMATKRKSV